jgi:hypothetical protein
VPSAAVAVRLQPEESDHAVGPGGEGAPLRCVASDAEYGLDEGGLAKPGQAGEHVFPHGEAPEQGVVLEGAADAEARGLAGPDGLEAHSVEDDVT